MSTVWEIAVRCGLLGLVVAVFLAVGIRHAAGGAGDPT